MRKIILITLCSTLFSLYSFSQTNSIGIGGGISVFSADTNKSSQVGGYISLNFYNFYFSLASNFARGKGEELDFSSSQTYNSNKVSVGVINIGYIIQLNNFAITPLIGWGWSREIFEDPVAFDTYFYGDSKSHFNAGAKGMVKIKKHIGLSLGVGTYERFSGGVNFYF